jgi:hypothetical protein
VQQPNIREIGLPNLLWLLRRIEMPKSASTPAKARKTVVVEDDEEEEVVAPRPKAVSKNGKTNGKAVTTATVTKTNVKTIGENGVYTPNKNSMRELVMVALKKGGTTTQVKERAARIANKRGLKEFADVKAFKHFDVPWYVGFLNKHGHDFSLEAETAE